MSLKRISRILIPVAAAVLPPPAACRAASALSTAPIDYSLYRDGEVERIEHRYASWLLTCDSIRRLGQKFCSLRTVARSADGTIVAALTVSTDDRGMPAALVTLPYGVILATGTQISFVAKAAERVSHTRDKSLRLQPVSCSGNGCQLVWQIQPDDIQKLRAGQDLGVRFQMIDPYPFPSLAIVSGKTVFGSVEALGFSQALQASLR